MPRKKPFYQEYGELLRQTCMLSNITTEERSAMYNMLNNLAQENLPQSLFRYRTCEERNFDAFYNDRLYFSHPNSFNDPHDCLVYFNGDKIKKDIRNVRKQASDYVERFADMIKSMHSTKNTPFDFSKIFTEERIKKIEESLENPNVDQAISLLPGYLEDFLSYIETDVEISITSAQEYFRNNPWIACFSSELREPLMWSYYADSHRGFALEYNLPLSMIPCSGCPSSQTCSLYPLFAYLYPIVYTDRKFDATDFAVYLTTQKIYEKYGIKEDLLPLYDELTFRKANVFKAKYWRHEREWRMEFRCSNDKMRNWMPLKPKAIYLGTKISSINKEILRKLAQGKNISIYQMDDQPNTARYKLEYSPIG